MSTKCKRVFSSAKYLITDPRNRLKADIIEVNKCLKSWFRCPQAKAFIKGVNPDIDKQYKEEAAVKAATKGKAWAEDNIVVNIQEADKQEDEEDKDSNKDSNEEDIEDKEAESDTIKYILINS